VLALLEEVDESQLGLELAGGHDVAAGSPEVEGVDVPAVLHLGVHGLCCVRKDLGFPT
jgi:hypothetical protein